MSPKDKAEELVLSFENASSNKMSDYSKIYTPTAKVCAFICVDEIIKELESVEFNYDLHNFNKTSLENTVIEYYKEVKQEIENL